MSSGRAQRLSRVTVRVEVLRRHKSRCNEASLEGQQERGTCGRRVRRAQLMSCTNMHCQLPNEINATCSTITHSKCHILIVLISHDSDNIQYRHDI